MIRTCKQLEKALREVNEGIGILVQKVGITYRVNSGGYRLTRYSVQDLVQEMDKETVALDYFSWCKDEGRRTIYIKGLKAKK